MSKTILKSVPRHLRVLLSICFRKTIVFFPQGRDSCFFAIANVVLNELPAARAHTLFCYTSLAILIVLNVVDAKVIARSAASQPQLERSLFDV